MIKRHVLGVSFPRSGHAMIVQVLRTYFGASFHHCDYQRHCRRRPCVVAGNNLQKNHDFDLKLPVHDDCSYLIQYRHPLYAVTSNYFLWLGKQNLPAEGQPLQQWRAFAARDIRQWKKWVRKWVIGNNNPRALKLAYEHVLQQPAEQIERVIRFFDSDGEICQEKIRAIVQQHKIAPRRTLDQFPFYEPDFFAELESFASQEIEALGLSWIGDKPVPRKASTYRLTLRFPRTAAFVNRLTRLAS